MTIVFEIGSLIEYNVQWLSNMIYIIMLEFPIRIHLCLKEQTKV